MVKLLHRLLEIPFVFQLQQRLCNDYGSIARGFSAYLDVPPLDILEVGCSTGACAATVVDMKRHRYTGIDLAENYIVSASKRYPDGRFLVADARQMRFPDQTFDLAMCVGVLHHMDDATVRSCLREVRRVLRKSGHVLVAEPVFTPGKWVSSLFLSMDRGAHIRADHGYRALFDGFKVISERRIVVSLHTFCTFVLTSGETQSA